jgi:hypothetical protein
MLRDVNCVGNDCNNEGKDPPEIATVNCPRHSIAWCEISTIILHNARETSSLLAPTINFAVVVVVVVVVEVVEVVVVVALILENKNEAPYDRVDVTCDTEEFMLDSI